MEPGTRLLHYRLVEKLGEGGMGVVWRARDGKLDRDVAIKILPAAVSADPGRVARFEREAKLLAALSHPNIAAVYGFERAPATDPGGEAVRFLVMELVDGEDLATLLARGALRPREALSICREVAVALTAAHERGIIHRDLKPANVKVTRGGGAKVLDFGLAKALQADAALDPAHSPTVTSGDTEAGVILGTAAYMSPEQVRGLPLDRRTDVWSLGCVLFEAIAGVAPFRRATVADTLAAVLEHEPDWNSLPATTPARARSLLRRCLRKELARRLRDAGDAGLELDEALAGPEREAGDAAVPEPRRLPYWSALPLLALGLAAALWWGPRRVVSGAAPVPSRFAITLPEPLSVDIGPRSPLALSPDGRLLAFVGRREDRSSLYLRPLDSFSVSPIADTVGGDGPFFSPDGRWLGFLRGSYLMRLPVDGGAPLSIARVAPVASGFDWATERDLYFSVSKVSGLMRVTPDGGAYETVIVPDTESGEEGVAWADVLPGESAALLTVKKQGPSYDDASIVLADLGDGSRSLLVEGGYHGRMLPTGVLVYVRGGMLFGARLDLRRKRLASPAVPLLDGFVTDPSTGSAAFAFSGNGTMAYLAGTTLEWQQGRLVWVDRQGGVEPVSSELHSFRYPRVSPDGSRLLFTREEASDDVWLYDLARGGFTRLTFKNRDMSPLWRPDGDEVTFSSVTLVGGPSAYPAVYCMPADGSAQPRALMSQNVRRPLFPSSWSPDGETLAYMRWGDAGGFDVMVADEEGTGPPRPFLDSEFDEHMAAFSPDGRWIAYSSDETGRMEVYVQPYPGPGGKWKVSTEGGGEPVWNPTGGELFYRDGDKMMAVAVSTEGEFRASRPQLLFRGAFARRTLAWITNYDVSRDGKRFLMIEPAKRPDIHEIRVVQNWFTEVEQALADR